MDKALAPGFARTTYTGDTGVHHHITPLNIVDGWTAGTDPSVTLKDTTTVAASVAMTDYWDVIRELLAEEQNIGLCEIYAVDADTGEGTFIFGFNLALTGNVAADGTDMGMMTLSLKLTNGKGARVVLLDTPFAANLKVRPPFDALTPIDIATEYLVGGTSPYYGRGNSYPFAPIALTTKTSDVLRKREGLS